MSEDDKLADAASNASLEEVPEDLRPHVEYVPAKEGTQTVSPLWPHMSVNALSVGTQADASDSGKGSGPCSSRSPALVTISASPLMSYGRMVTWVTLGFAQGVTSCVRVRMVFLCMQRVTARA